VPAGGIYRPLTTGHRKFEPKVFDFLGHTLTVFVPEMDTILSPRNSLLLWSRVRRWQAEEWEGWPARHRRESLREDRTQQT